MTGTPIFYCFRYTIKGDKTKKVYISNRIRKIDLYNKEIYTTEPTVKFILPSNIEV